MAGTFYPKLGADLAREVEGCFESERGPGELPTRQRSAERHLRAAVVPHAGFRFSGPIAALAFSAIARERPPDHVLILGVDHHGAARAPALSGEDWATPLGPVGNDAELLRALSMAPIRRDDAAHAREHSIEVELPFLQYVLPAPTFVGLMVPFGSYAQLAEVGNAVRVAIEGLDVLVIASTDFSHYVSAESARALDHRAIDRILQGDPAGLYQTVTEHDISMCGIAPTTVLLAALEDEPLTPRLLRWGHSGEAEPMHEVVGYASILFESASPLGVAATAD